MKRVAICTLFYKNCNYGGILQCYALQKALFIMGHDVKVVAYNDKLSVNPIYPSLYSRCQQYSLKELFCKVLEILMTKINKSVLVKLNQRIELFKKFIDNNIQQTKVVGDENLTELSNCFDIFISGSDQVWNPNAIRKLYLQTFETRQGVKRVSYAASISRNSLSPLEQRIIIPAIRKFDSVSVREKTAKDILDKAGLNKSVDIVVDPTLLLPVEEWEKIACNRLINEPYVLMYSFSNCIFKKDLIEYYKQKNKKVYFIPYVKQSFNTFDKGCQMEPVWNVGPAEFLSLIKYADVIYTDSFHGAVFSIIFNREFVVYERDTHGQTSKNSRLYDLLDTFNLGNRLIQDEFMMLERKTIDYENVNSILNILRSKSNDWLKNALQ